MQVLRQFEMQCKSPIIRYLRKLTQSTESANMTQRGVCGAERVNVTQLNYSRLARVILTRKPDDGSTGSDVLELFRKNAFQR